MTRRGSLAPADDWAAALPLYVASLVVTLAGVGAVGVTVSFSMWTPVWALLAVTGHAASLVLRRMRVSAESIFFPVMLIGGALVMQQSLAGSPLVGMDSALGSVPTDMATAMTVGMLAVVRCFTLVTNSSLLFSPVPAITMLALVGSSNPNAEVPLFFGLALLGSLFVTGYEAHLRRVERSGRATGLVVLHLVYAWGFTLLVAGAAVAATVVVQPILSPLSPFSLPAMSQFRGVLNFTQTMNNQAPVGQGPIRLSNNPVYEVYSEEGGRLRTGVFTRYSGRDWSIGRNGVVVDQSSSERVELAPPATAESLGVEPYAYLFHFPGDSDLGSGVATRDVRQKLVTRGRVPQGVPALGAIVELRYPRMALNYHSTGMVTGSGHTGAQRMFEVVSRVPVISPRELQSAPVIDPDTFDDPEALELPQSSLEVQLLARRLVSNVPNPYDRVQTFIRYIEDNCRYTLLEDYTPQGEDAAAYYLFKSKRGACDLAATAATVMCRAVGIPARVAVGYVADEPLQWGGGFMVRQSDAHMWVEAYFPGYGWVPFDPAPPLDAVRENPFDVAMYRFREVFRKIGGGGLDTLLLLVVIVVTAVLLVYGAWPRLRAWLKQQERRRQAVADKPAAAIIVAYDHALRLLRRRGWRREPWMTPREYLYSLREDPQAPPEALAAVQELTDLFQRAQYASVASPEDAQAASELAARLSRLVPRRNSLRGSPVRPAESPA